MERHCRGNQRPLKALGRHTCDERGQSTVEFALVTAALLIVVVACSMLWRRMESGLFVEHALSSASHHIELAAPGSIADVFLY